MLIYSFRIGDNVRLKDGTKEAIIIGLLSASAAEDGEDTVQAVTNTGSEISFHPSAVDDFNCPDDPIGT